jgi:lycopene beta-cyclase
MDFRVPQRDGLRFGHHLPEAPGHGLFELCSFRVGGPDPDLAVDLPAWIAERLGGSGYRAEPVEQGTYPLVRRGSRLLGPRHLAIGRNAGLVRPSTGYGVAAYARDAAAVVDSLARHGDPFHLRRTGRRDAALDAVALEVLRRDPATLQRAYLDLFDRNPPERVLRFLDGTATARDVARLVATMPIAPFTAAAARRLTGLGSAPEST